MMFSAADIPIQSTTSFGGIFEQLRKIDPTSPDFSRAQIDSLTVLTDKTVALSHEALDLILDYDVRWRTAVFQGKTEYDEAIENRIETGLVNWADGAVVLLDQLDRLRPFGFHPETVETLRPRVAEVLAMLTPDDEFFEGEELDNLAEKAISEHEAGRTVEFRVMGE